METIDQMVRVIPIAFDDARPWLLYRHYAHRIPSISFAFGAYRDGKLLGVVTYGTPASSPLRAGIAGVEFASLVLELNRLCCESEHNLASILVGRSLTMLPKPSIVVSYADCAQGHVGYVYQATNFIYTGLSAKRTDWKVRGQEHLHGQTVADLSRGQANRAEWMRAKFGDDFYLLERSRKHRYVFFCGDRRQVRSMRAALKYQQQPFPKGDTTRSVSENTFSTQGLLL